jgi:DNA-binding beta-propeller fold protein YncE
MTRSAAIRRALLPMLVAALPACGGGGGGESAQASPVALTFPAGTATTDAETIAIRGSVALAPPINSVKVNGIDAVSSDGFATFFAEVPLSTGPHDVVVAVLRPNLPTQLFTFADRLTRVDPIVVDVTDIVFDDANGRLLLADRAGHSIVAADVATGARTILSDFERGAGFNMIHPISLAVDATGKTAWVLDEEGDLVLAVDLVHGDRTLLSGGGVGSGPTFGRPVGVAFDPTSQVLLVADADLAAVFSVDVTNGKRTILSDATHGTGTALFSPSDLAFDEVSHRVVVSDRALRALIAVGPVTGNRTVLSDFTHGTGPFFDDPGQVTVDPFYGVVHVTDAFTERVFFVDSSSGNRSLLTEDEPRGGTQISRPGATAVDQVGKCYVVDDDERKVVRLDPRNLERDRFVELPAVGTGPSLDQGERVAVDPRARLAWVVVDEPPAVVQVNLATGARSILCDATHGAGRPFVDPRAIAFDAARRRLLVGDDSDDSLWSVSLTNGARALLSIEPVVAGNDLHRTFEIVLDETHGRALLVQNDDLILAVDLKSGARSEFSFEDPVVFQATRMDGGALDLENDRLLVHDQEIGLFACALTDGARTLLSALVGNSGQDGGSGMTFDAPGNRFLLTPRAPLPSGVGQIVVTDGDLEMISSSDAFGRGRGPASHRAVTLAVDAARASAIVRDDEIDALFEVDLVSGDRVIVSR